MTPLPKNLQAKMEAAAARECGYMQDESFKAGYQQCYSDLNDELSAKNAALENLVSEMEDAINKSHDCYYNPKSELSCEALGVIIEKALDHLRKFREQGK